MTVIYPERESKSLELKSKIPTFHALIKTCVAFANGMGGKIIIGVDDKTRMIVGINNEIRNRIYDDFPNSIYDATSPSLLVEIYEKNFNDVSVMIIDVPASIKKPVYIKSEGSSKGVYLRAGSSTRKANEENIEELFRENKRSYYDEEPIHTDIKILSKDLLQKIYNNVNTSKLISENIITRISPAAKNFYPTVAGILGFCEQPHEYIPEAIVQCTRFAGIEGRNIIQTEEIHGNINKQLDVSFNLIHSWLLRNYQLTGVKLAGQSIIPEDALREAIANALIHRKYSVPGAVKIALFDNRLEIFSPGNFPGLVDISNLGDGTTYLRNPHLAKIARRTGIIEKLGTGVKLIFESCQNAGIKKPEYIEGTDSVKVIFHFLPADDKFSQDRDKILKLFKIKNEVTLNEIQNYLNVSRNTATRKLNELIKDGEIQRIGKGPAVKYIYKY